jgi:hypothetical protein
LTIADKSVRQARGTIIQAYKAVTLFVPGLQSLAQYQSYGHLDSYWIDKKLTNKNMLATKDLAR